MFTIEGFISTCSHNAARSAPDRQYLYVNKRPCEHARLVKLINEQFHQFNRNQYPMFVLNIVTHTENVDVNVTPDKLQMFIRHEAALMAIIKSSLVKMYLRLYTTVNVSDTSIVPSPKSQAIMSSFLIKPANTSAKLVSNQLNENEENEKIDLKLVETKRPILEPSPERVRQVLSVLSSPKQQQGNNTEKSEPPKRSREDLSPPSEFFRERVLKQPKLTSESPARRSNSKSPPDIRDLLRKPPQSPQFLTVKPIYGSSSTSSDSGSPFSLTEKKSMFQNRIGSPIKISEEPSSSSLLQPLASSSMMSTMMDSSFADRIDLHMCNRQTAVLDSPAVETRTHRRILEQDEEDYSKPKG